MRNLILLLVVLTLTSCASWKKPKDEPPAPRIDCSERTAAEPLPSMPDSTDYRRWAAYGRRLLGVIEAEVTKRVEVADCLDEYRAKGLIK